MIHDRTLKALEYDKIIVCLANFCLSEQGRELALNLRPSDNFQTVQERLRNVEQCHILLSKIPDTKFFFAFPDIRGVLRKAAVSQPNLDTDAFWAIRDVLRLAKTVRNTICTANAVHDWPDLLNAVECVPQSQMLLPALERCLSDDCLLKDESSPELYLVRTELRRLHQSCMHKVRDYAVQYNMLSYLQDEFMTLASDRYVLPLKANFKGRMQGIIHDWSQTGETCYFEPMFLVDINNKLQELKHEERKEEHKVLTYLTSLLLNEVHVLEGTVAFLAELDVLLAKLALSERYEGRCLTVTDGSDDSINLLETRHPLLAINTHKTSDFRSEIRPLNISLRHRERALVISGGNAGGKTVCLKTLGLTAAMTFAGIPVAVGKGSSIPFWKRIDAFIGDEQSLDDHVSTFTAQIQHLAKSWKYMDASTLVLLDEFGAGTEPAQGAALAQAVLEELLERKAYVLAATHFPSLKLYALAKDNARAASVLFDSDTKKPLFALAYDQVGASRALDVAREYGMPECILSRAQSLISDDVQKSGHLLNRLNSVASIKEKELDKLKMLIKKQQDDFKRICDIINKERQNLANEVRQNSNEIIKLWKQNQISRKQALNTLSNMRGRLECPSDKQKTELLSITSICIGDTVFYRPFSRKAVIIEIDSRKNAVRLDMNGVSVWAKLKDLEKGNAADTKIMTSVSHTSSATPQGLTLDLRGMRVDVAIRELEQFLDRTLLNGFETIEIVHGRGTGMLRKEIHKYLKTFPAVQSFSLAPEDRGGDGLTQVTLK